VQSTHPKVTKNEHSERSNLTVALQRKLEQGTTRKRCREGWSKKQMPRVMPSDVPSHDMLTCLPTGRRSSERTESQFPQGIYLLRCIYQANADEQSPQVVPMTKALVLRSPVRGKLTRGVL
jgi:hypothetical protein